MSLFYRLVLLVLFSVFFVSRLSAQLDQKQIEAIKQIDFTNHTFDKRKPKFISMGKSPFVKYNPVFLTLGGMLFFYQKAISPQLQSHCPYEISCSAFSKTSIQEFGIIKGVPLTADRLTRCTQFTLIDILPSQVNEHNGSIIDNIDKYKLNEKKNK
jgi:putative component of membrane protein insertase Oxa1/YidC/SpoIIIJ protein YidD